MRCLLVDDDDMARMLMEHYISQVSDLELVATCESAIQAANVLKKQSVDLIFLDVEMPEMTGLEFIQSLEHRPMVILVSAKEQYAVEAFDVEVTDYMVKPVKYARFLKAVQRAQSRMLAAKEKASPEQDYVFIKTEGRLVKLALTDIQWIEAQGDYVRIHTVKENYVVHGTIKGFEEKLPANAFSRVHRSFIVRIDQIVDIADSSIVIGRSVIPIGASFKDMLLKRLKTI
ncbi:MAG: response regulator transcription factor [Bacteroidetes Order II. Incertae sedis bacterium]|nr:response regulator transcription factor [Bacteroidetes Order II. bacterium]